MRALELLPDSWRVLWNLEGAELNPEDLRLWWDGRRSLAGWFNRNV
jgi:hypothetical protein